MSIVKVDYNSSSTQRIKTNTQLSITDLPDEILLIIFKNLPKGLYWTNFKNTCLKFAKIYEIKTNKPALPRLLHEKSTYLEGIVTIKRAEEKKPREICDVLSSPPIKRRKLF